MNSIAKEIYEAASYGDTEVVKRLLKIATFADLIYKNPHDLHKTAVMVAAYHGHTEIVRAIFAHSIASVHIQDEAGWTALMFAAYKGNTPTINAILLHPEVDVNVQNNDGWTALMMAAAEGRPCTVRALLTRADIDVNLQNNQDGGTALLLACIKGHTEIVRDILSKKGVLVNLEDNEGRLPVFAAKNDEITALINFYNPEVGLVYPVHDLPLPPTHTVAPMPPLPPAHSPQLALSVDYADCAEEVHALLPLLPSIHLRGQWRRNRLALQRKMEAAVHIHHHKEAALIGRELLAFNATTASTAALRALSENDYVHLPDKVVLLQTRVHRLCEKLALAQDFDTLDQAALLVVALEQVQTALTQASADPPVQLTPAPTEPVLETEHHPVVHFAEKAVLIGSAGKGVGVVEVSDDSDSGKAHSGGVSKSSSSDEDHKVHFAEQAVVIDNTGAGVDVVKITDEPHEVHVLEGASGIVSGSVHVGGGVMPPPPPNTPSHTELAIKKRAGTTASADGSALPPPPPHITSTVTADPENQYLPQYAAYSNTVPQGTYGVHTTITTALEALALSQAQVEKLQHENEGLKELNRTLSDKGGFSSEPESIDAGYDASVDTASTTSNTDVLMPPPPPSA